MRFSRRSAVILIVVLVCVPALLRLRARGSDFASTPALAAKPGTDIADLYIFPSPTSADNLVFVMNVHPLIPTGQSGATVFDPNVLYQFKIDVDGDFVEDLVIQARFTGSGSNQTVQIAGPLKPSRTGTQTVFETPDPMVGTINQPFTLSTGVRVFAGAREDPFFFDVNQFFTLLPDRANPLFGSTFTNTSGATVSTTLAQPNQLMASAWRPAGQAQDFFKSLNVLSIVVEVPKSLLRTGGDGKLRVWCTTSL